MPESASVLKKRLGVYRKKRDFARTSEPAGAVKPRRRSARASGPIYIVQKHDATRLHYDFRLEIGGVLKSWAVPKGPSMDPVDKRLAVPTEDHPMEYASFEGVIPENSYGAGPVIVWDAGFWENLTVKHGEPIDAERAVEHGHLRFRLEGKKLRGEFALSRMPRREGEKKDSWLLVKIADAAASRARLVEKRPESVLTGRTIEDVLNGKNAKRGRHES